MEQLKLNLFPKRRRRTLIVNTMPVNLHKINVINMGMMYAAKALDADVCHWRDSIKNISQYDTIGFSVIYLTHVLNIAPFLHRHNIEPRKYLRKSPQIIIGGQGATSLNGGLDRIGETFLGEADGDYSDKNMWRWKSVLDGEPAIGTDRSIVEISRGCKYRCRFCGYSHVSGGPYREKEIGLIKEQIDYCQIHCTKRITLRTANLAGHTDLDELLEHCLKHKIYQGWTDISLIDAERILKWLEPLRITAPKIGVESFDEKTRMNVCGSAKKFTDEYLEHVFEELMKRCNLLHVYLIYGLPGDNYTRWFDWVRKLSKMRETFKKNKLRMDFSITNFNPYIRTPMEKAPTIDFTRKKQFIKEWIAGMKESGFYKPDADMTPGKDYGRHGRLETSYKLIMALRFGTADEMSERIIEALPYGVGRSIPGKDALKFLNYGSEMSSG